MFLQWTDKYSDGGLDPSLGFEIYLRSLFLLNCDFYRVYWDLIVGLRLVFKEFLFESVTYLKCRWLKLFSSNSTLKVGIFLWSLARILFFFFVFLISVFFVYQVGSICKLSNWGRQMMNGVECSVCRSKLVSPGSKTISRAYDDHKIRVSSKQKVLNVLLVVGDCMLVGLQVNNLA